LALNDFDAVSRPGLPRGERRTRYVLFDEFDAGSGLARTRAFASSSKVRRQVRPVRRMIDVRP